MSNIKVLLIGLGILFISISFRYIFTNDILYVFSPQASVDFNDTSGEYDYSSDPIVFDNQNIVTEKYLVDNKSNSPDNNETVLGEKTDHKHIEVDLTNQRLYAFEGGKKVFDFLISSGKWGKTPTGRFKIWVKLRYTKMEGGSKALNTYYYLPNVPYVMFFANEDIPSWRGFGIHGTYWHNNFGNPMSHGCINMKTEEVAQLYEWATPELGDKKSIWASTENPGTEIIIYGKAPNS